MHYLHKILVYIPEITDTPNEMSREDLLKEIRSHADSTTDDC